MYIFSAKYVVNLKFALAVCSQCNANPPAMLQPIGPRWLRHLPELQRHREVDHTAQEWQTAAEVLHLHTLLQAGCLPRYAHHNKALVHHANTLLLKCVRLAGNHRIHITPGYTCRDVASLLYMPWSRNAYVQTGITEYIFMRDYSHIYTYIISKVV